VPVDHLLQNGEIAADCFDIEGLGREAEIAEEAGLAFAGDQDRVDAKRIDPAGSVLRTMRRRGRGGRVSYCAGKLRRACSDGRGEGTV